VIVDPAWRRQGLARRLMGECMDELRHQGRAALLDATPAGALVYRGLGFVELTTMERWEGEGGSAATKESGVVAPAVSEELIAADAQAFGAPRHFLLEDFLSRDGTSAWHYDDSYVVMRRGHRAMQIGPLIATSDEAARVLLATAIAEANGSVFLDLLEPWNSLAALLETCGFTRQRPFVRMACGRPSSPGDPRRLAIAAGPEFG